MSDDTSSKPNVDNTAKLAELFAVPREERDKQWTDSFFSTLPLAALKTQEERVFNGPDGFLYFGLFMPEEQETFTAVCFEDVLEFCSKEGLGIAVFGTKLKEPEWVFNYGSIWSYQIHHNFYENPFANSPFDDNNEGEADGDAEDEKRSESVLVASPSEEYLPLFVRAVILRDLEQQNVSEPALLVMTVPNEATYLVFNVFPDDFDEQHFEFIQQYLVWVLPQGYSIATVAADSDLNEHFIGLREMLDNPVN